VHAWIHQHHIDAALLYGRAAEPLEARRALHTALELLLPFDPKHANAHLEEETNTHAYTRAHTHDGGRDSGTADRRIRGGGGGYE